MVTISTECCRLDLSQQGEGTLLFLPRSTVVFSKTIAAVSDTRASPCQNVECFHEARFVTIAHGRLAIWLDPFGMLCPQIVVNLFLQICVRIELVTHNHSPIWLFRLHRKRVSD